MLVTWLICDGPISNFFKKDMSCKCAKCHSLIMKGTIFTPNCWTTKTKPLEAWRLRRLTSFGINLQEIANILTGMRHVGTYCIPRFWAHVIYPPKGDKWRWKHHLFILKNKIRSIRIVALADQEGGKMQNEMNFNERVSEEILHIK